MIFGWLKQIISSINEKVDKVLNNNTQTLTKLDDTKSEVIRAGKAIYKLNTTNESLMDSIIMQEKELEKLKEEISKLHKEKEDETKNQIKDKIYDDMAKLLIPAVDGLHEAINSINNNAYSHNNGMKEGLQLIYKRLIKALEQIGIVPISAIGKPFDPLSHIAIDKVESEAMVPNTVVDEVVRGYFKNGQVYKYSEVIVACNPEKGNDQRPSQNGTLRQEDSMKRMFVLGTNDTLL